MVTGHARIRAIRVTGLQGMYDYEVKFPDGCDTIILIAPNGYGKTAFLSLVNSCLQLRIVEAARHNFKTFDVIFEDKSRWNFEKIVGIEDPPSSWDTDRNRRLYTRRSARSFSSVKVAFYDPRGRIRKDEKLFDFGDVPPGILARAIERVLPVSRESPDTFLDFRSSEMLNLQELLEKNYNFLINSPDFLVQLEPFGTQSKDFVGRHVNCVFIETQRLLYSKRPQKSDSESSKEPEEEIMRQAQSLASMLQSTYSTYASTSQALDRSFPNRLIARAERPTAPDAKMLRSELDGIENKRKALTEAGILVETAERLIPPKDEFLPNVADALGIYVEDSKEKLATFDDIYGKVSVFKELLTKKLRPKDLIINRENGAEVRRGGDRLNLSGLSSGEKHEFIMLFRLIFETPQSSLVLIDEPEISLHVVWQLEFMGDLQRVQKLNNLQSIIATHSPQIIQGAGDITIDLSDQAQ